MPDTEKHYQLATIDTMLRYTIPPRKRGMIMLFDVILLLGLTLIAITTGGTLISGESPTVFGGNQLLMIAAIILWVLAVSMVIFGLLWQLAGRELVEVDATSLRLRREIFGVGRTREYPAERVNGLRVTEYDQRWDAQVWWNANSFRSVFFDGPLAFDYQYQTLRFGNGLDEAGAQQIVHEIRERYPQYVETGIVRR